MKYRKRKPNRTYLYIAIAIFALISLFFIEYRLHALAEKELSKQAEPPTAEQASQTQTNSNTNANLAKSTTPEAPINQATAEKTAGLQIPILMYHYIRDYNDPNDKIGTNLSVSPDNFKQQLEVISRKGYTPITFLDIESGNIPQNPIILTFDDGYSDFYTNAWPILKEKNYKAVSYIITGYSGNNYMTAEEIRGLSDSGIEIGSHTIDHPDLSKTTEQKTLREISESRAGLENITGKKVISFCYPSGKFTAETIRLVKKQGYKYATTTQSGTADFKNHFELSRFRMTNQTSLEKVLK